MRKIDYEKLQEKAAAQGLTIKALEVAAGLSPNTMGPWRKSVPGVDKAAAVAKVLGCSIEELLTEEDPLEELEAPDAEELRERLAMERGPLPGQAYIPGVPELEYRKRPEPDPAFDADISYEAFEDPA